MNRCSWLALRLASLLAAVVLVAVLVLAWDIRPALPSLPNSLSAPLPASTITAALEVAAWGVFVLLDLVLLTMALKRAATRLPFQSQIRLRAAFAENRAASPNLTDWRSWLAPLGAPVLRLPLPHAPEPQPVPAEPARERGDESSERAPTLSVADHRGRIGIRLLGPLELAGTKKKQPRRQATAELIAYLTIQRRRVNRDELLEALWPNDDPRRGAARFYQAASEARKLLGAAFLRDRDSYGLDRSQIRVDLDELDQLREEALRTRGGEQRAFLEQALTLFRGEPLAGIEALWMEGEQRRLVAVRVDLLERAGRLRLEAGDAAGALALAEEAAGLDLSNERPVRLAIEAEAALGRRESVVERYERLRRELDERFGLEPSRETRQLFRRVLGQDAVSA
jgi:DNA-binding SARP family transcriptional activator